MDTIAVVDYGMGNLHSVARALEHVADAGSRVMVTSDAGEIARAQRVVFPGQGAARHCMRAIHDHGLSAAICDAARSKPFLGICMGLQVLMDYSDENQGTRCLGFFRGRTGFFGDVLNDDEVAGRLKIPHMGWNQVTQARAHPLWEDVPQGARFYFVHSYFLQPEEESLTVGTTDYGIGFTSAIARDNVFALQCHPEKSAQAGLTLLGNFVRWDGTI